MLNYVWAFSWGLAMLLASLGWGTVVERVLYPSRRRDPGHLAIWGLSLQVVVGGVLNLTAWAAARNLVGLVGLGLILFVVDLISSRREWIAAARELLPG